MSEKELDPKTATVEEVAAASRRLRRSKIAPVIAGAITGAAALLFIVPSPSLPDGWGLPITFIAIAIGYIPTDEILKRR